MLESRLLDGLGPIAYLIDSLTRHLQFQPLDWKPTSDPIWEDIPPLPRTVGDIAGLWCHLSRCDEFPKTLNNQWKVSSQRPLEWILSAIQLLQNDWISQLSVDRQGPRRAALLS